MLSLKGNQGELHEDVRTWFDSAPTEPMQVNIDGGHGRIETRQLRTGNELQWLRQRHPQWKGLNTIVALTTTRELQGRQERQSRYFISSLDPHSARLAHAIRAHWAIENSLRWVLDVAFDEDRCRARRGYSAANLSMIRHVALNLIN